MTARDGILEADSLLTGELRDRTDVADSAPGAASTEEADANLRLDLLLPGTLPSRLVLETGERERVRALLQDTLTALRLSDKRQAAVSLKRLLSSLSDSESTPAIVEETGTPAKADHVDDFDNYFRVNRISASRPALSLVRGLLQTSSAAMDLFASSNELKPERFAQQVDGFAAYTRLLARTFDLEEPA